MPVRHMTLWHIGILAGLSGCSLSTYDYQECSTNAECRDTFGWGNVCDAETLLCAPARDLERCAETWPEDLLTSRDKYADWIVLGALMDGSAWGLELDAMKLAVIQANQESGLDGTDYGLVMCTSEEDSALDDLEQADANVEAALYLADEIGVPAIVGPDTSGRTTDAFVAVEPLGTMVISPSATSPALISLDGVDPTDKDPGLLWRTAPPDSLQGQVIADYLASEGAATAAVVYQTGPYGEGLAEVFDAAFRVNGGTTVLLPFTETSQRDSAIVDAAFGDYDEVVFISSEKSDYEGFLDAAATFSAYTDGSRGVFFTDTAYAAELYTNAGDAEAIFPYIRGSRPTFDETTAVYSAFLASFAAEYEGADAGDSAYTAHAYDAAWLAIYGTAWSLYQNTKIFGLGIARGMRHVSGGTAVDIRPTSWSTVRAIFETGADVDVTGASGLLDYSDEDGETTAPIEVWELTDTGSTWELTSVTVVQP